MKKRIDSHLVEQGYFQSREGARRSIMAGEVTANGKRIEKPGQLVEASAIVAVAQTGQQYVSRGAFKLEKALKVFEIDVKGRICLDAGASTGGFTDLLLQAGARQVVAVDVGYGQLAWKLRQDSRVIVFERQNVRYFEPGWLAERPSLITADLSFISLRLLFSKFSVLLAPGGELISLIKPQFEAGKANVGKKGVVRDNQVHLGVLQQLTAAGAADGWRLINLSFSPLLGPEGNIEFLGHWTQGAGEPFEDLERVVADAWTELKATNH